MATVMATQGTPDVQKTRPSLTGDDSFVKEDLGDDHLTLTRMLCFSQASLEERYAAEVAQKVRTLAWRCLFLLSLYCILDILVYGHLADFTHEELVARLGAWGRVTLLLIMSSCTLLVYRGCVTIENAQTFLVVVLNPIFVLNSSERMSVVFKTDYFTRKYGGHSDGDAFYILVLLIMCSAPMICSVRFRKAWFVLPWSVTIYVAGSVNGVGPHSTSTTILLSVGYACVASIFLYATYVIERQARLSWADNLRLRRAASLHEIEINRHRQWLAELEDRLAAFESIRTDHDEVGMLPEASKAMALVQKNTVPPPHLSSKPPGRAHGGGERPQEPNAILVHAMAGRVTDAKQLRRMADQIAQPSYGMRQFFEDCIKTFPELDLFYETGNTSTASSSGVSAEVEYQRTFGALFAVYWLLRLPGDGKDGFCFGLDDSWNISDGSHHGTRQKRVKFLGNMQWPCIQELLDCGLEQSLDRIEAILCLTAFHDIMKVQALCPQVSPQHAPYEGYASGDIINDHDVALAYVLEHFPDLLPSFRVLPAESRSVILFTQGKMHFNHGWFVQAEAPPGPMLSKFKSVLGKARPSDLAFYFLHWLTDLSGAEGRPLAGAEKFVLKFPQSVLTAFLWSIPFLQRLTSETETQVMECYLEARLRQEKIMAPKGPESVALHRLSIMAQGAGKFIQDAFYSLPSRVRDGLAVELARTGIASQQFSGSPQVGGPALFVYYGPALLQRCSCTEDMRFTLAMLAALYRAGRELWPASASEAGLSVILEAGALKANVDSVIAGRYVADDTLFVLERRSDIEASVVMVGGVELNILVRGQKVFTALERWSLEPDPAVVASMKLPPQALRNVEYVTDPVRTVKV